MKTWNTGIFCWVFLCYIRCSPNGIARTKRLIGLLGRVFEYLLVIKLCYFDTISIYIIFRSNNEFDFQNTSILWNISFSTNKTISQLRQVYLGTSLLCLVRLDILWLHPYVLGKYPWKSWIFCGKLQLETRQGKIEIFSSSNKLVLIQV